MTESDRRESERGKYALGAQFIATPDGPMFVYAIDANNVIGPRKATNSDKREHAGEWAAFEAEQPAAGDDGKYGKYTGYTTLNIAPDQVVATPPVPPKPDPFDHDHNGKPGGSLPKAKRKSRRKA